jgi:hypothetical protein
MPEWWGAEDTVVCAFIIVFFVGLGLLTRPPGGE